MYCLFCVVLWIVCVYMCTELLPLGGYPIAVKYIISYRIISYHIISISCLSVLGMRPALAWYQTPATASFPPSRVKEWTAGPLQMGPIGYPERSVTINLRCIGSQNSDDFISRFPATMLTKLWCQHKLHLTVSRQRSYSKILHIRVAYGKQYFIRLASWWLIKSKLTTLELI